MLYNLNLRFVWGTSFLSLKLRKIWNGNCIKS